MFACDTVGLPNVHFGVRLVAIGSPLVALIKRMGVHWQYAGAEGEGGHTNNWRLMRKFNLMIILQPADEAVFVI